MNPKFTFCGYPVFISTMAPGFPLVADPDNPKWWRPCGAIATPGCAYCDAHANAVVDDLPPHPGVSSRFDQRFADSVSMDTGSGFLANPFTGKRLTADDVVERAERRARRWKIIGELCRVNLLFILVAVALLFEPIHARMHDYRGFLCGVVFGAVIEGIVWGVWRWRKGDRP